MRLYFLMFTTQFAFCFSLMIAWLMVDFQYHRPITTNTCSYKRFQESLLQKHTIPVVYEETNVIIGKYSE